MRKLLLSSLVTVALCIGAPMTSANAGQLLVINHTRAPLIRFYARNNTFDELWHRDFEDNPIDPGESRIFTFKTRGECDDWNIEVDSPPNEMTKTWHQSVCGGNMEWVVNERFRGNAS
jgi:hypothetical protein